MSAFDELERLVKSGRVRIVFVLGLARGGTTAIEKYLYEKLPFDLQINEPSLLGPPVPGKDRKDMTFERVLDRIKGRDASTLLIKEVTNKVLPEMMPLWRRIVEWWIVVVRNPTLQIESRLKSMLDRIDSGALVPHNIRQDSNARTMLVHGQKVFVDAFENERVTWREAYDEAKRTRDFSMLGVGAMRACVLHPFCEWPESQRAMLNGRTVDDFSALSDEDCSKIVDWRLGWSALYQQIPDLSTSNTIVVDFSSVQMDGGARLIDWLYATNVFATSTDHSVDKEEFEACANSQLWSESRWQQWYGVPCFDKALKSKAIEPVSKRPLPLENFPPFLRDAVVDACRRWAHLISTDSRSLPSPRAALRAQFVGVDPLHDAVCSATSGPSAALWRFFGVTRRKRQNDLIVDRALRTLAEQDDDENMSVVSMILEILVALLVVAAQSCMLFQCALAYVWERRIRIVATPWLLLKHGEYPLPDDAVLSIIVPAHNEARTVGRCLEAVLERAADKRNLEIILVDAGSTDGTREVVEQLYFSSSQDEEYPPVKIVDYVEGGGRGPALNAGVAASSGSVLLFLHADTIVPSGYDDAIRQALRQPNIEIAAFGFRTSSRHGLVSKVLEACVNWRSRALQLPWGDQGLAMTRSRFYALDGGYRPIPVFEDLDMVVRARSQGVYRGRFIRTLDLDVETSARRYADLYAFVVSNLLNAFLVAWWHLGATPNQLFKLYYGTDIAELHSTSNSDSSSRRGAGTASS